MNAVLTAQDPSANYLGAALPALARHFALMATAPDGVARLRALILNLALQGKLLSKAARAESAHVLLQQIASRKEQLILEGRIKSARDDLSIDLQSLPFDLPAAWSWVRLGSIGSIGSSSRVHQSDWRNDGVPFYRAREIVALSKDGVVANELFITEELYENLAKRGWVPEPGDIMITGVGTIGVPYIVRKTDRFYFKDASVLIFKNHFGLNPDYLSLVFLSPYWIDSIHAESMGTTVHTLTISRASSALIPLPPRAEQAQIVARVDELMRLCDALEAKGRLEAEQHGRLLGTLLGTLTDSSTPDEMAANWQRVAGHFDLLLDRPEAVDALEQTILQLAVRGLLVRQDLSDESGSLLLQRIRADIDYLSARGQCNRQKPVLPIAEHEQPFAVPAGWVWTRLGEVSQVISGYAFSSEDFSSESGIRTIKITNAGVGEFHESDDYLPTRFESSFDNFKARADDLILALTRPYVSNGLKVSRCPASYDGALINQRVAAIRCYPGISNDFIYTYMQSADVLDIYKNRFNGSGLQPNLKVSDVTDLALPLPPVVEQFRISARVAELRSLCADLRRRLNASQTTQSHLAEALVAEVA